MRSLLCALALLLFLPAAAAAVPPDQDPFYVAPSGLDAVTPGSVLRSRSITNLASLPAASTHQILYRTTDQDGKPIATVATVFTPSQPVAGVRPLVSYQVAEDSLTLACAPSYTLQTAGQSTITVDIGYVTSLLMQGWDVVVPDYEGPHSAFAVPTLEARATLDGIRAAESFAPSGLTAASPVATLGYSGGSLPSVWAGVLASKYAPAVNLQAVAAGGVIAGLEDNLRQVDGGLYFGAIFTAFAGLDRGFPSLKAAELFNAAGRTELDATTRDVKGCGGAVLGYPGGTAKQYTNYPTMTALTEEPRVKAALDQLDLSTTKPPAVPMFIYNEVNDDVLRIKSVDKMVASYCSQGATLHYVRGPMGDHATGLVSYFSPALAYLKSRFAGAAPPNECPPPPPRATCASRRVVTLHVKQRGARRITASIAGRVVARRTGPGALRIALTGRTKSTVRVTVKITTRTRTIRQTRTFHPCAGRASV